MIQMTYETNDLTRNIVVQPGDSRDVGRIYIRNVGPSVISVSLYPVGFESYGGSRSIKSSIEISPRQIMIQPLSTGVAELKINIDKNVAPGTYSGYIVAVARAGDAREYIAKVVLSITVPLRIDSQYPRVHLQTFAGLSAGPSYYFDVSSPEWISFLVDVSQIPSTPLLLRFISKDSLVNMHIDDLLIISPTNEFISVETGNILFDSTGYHILVIGWLYGAYDEGTLSIDLYTSSAPPEIILSNVTDIYEELEDIRSRVSSLEHKISQIFSDVFNIDSALRGTKLDIEDLRLQINYLNNSIKDFRDNVLRYIEDLNKSIYKEVDKLYDEYTLLNESLRSYSTDLYEVIMKVETLYNEISELRSSFEKTNSTLSKEVNYLKIYVDNNLRNYTILLASAVMISIIALSLSLYVVAARRGSF